MGSRLKGGYGHATDPRGFLTTTTRIAWELASGQRPDRDKYLCHTCDNPPCVNPAHLFVGTPRDNVMDALAKGRVPCSLSPESVVLIRAKYAAGHTGRSLAAEYGVTPATISRAVRGLTYAHIHESEENAA
jgi:hypothetical protein